MIKEVWKDIPWYEWLYQISNCGRVKTFNYLWHWREKICKNTIHSTWYLVTWLTRKWNSKQYKIHRLVAQAFLNLDINSDLIVCHRDDNPKNNYVDNLFIWTHKDNSDDKIKKNRHCKWIDVHSNKLTTEEVIKIKKLVKTWKIKKSEIARKFNVSKCTVWDITKGRSWNWLII